ncbi:MAG: GNAT family N-acetyltransferase [Rhodobacteraceae bacterium]|nr:GNAT family N-acetyltransferase [Paracoccaceae bacterium]
MRFALRKGRYAARFAASDTDIIAAQRLRHSAFRGGEGIDGDRFDARCRHVLIEETRTGRLVACFRLLHLAGGAEIDQCYSAQYYGLSRLAAFTGPMVEMGRFCIAPDVRDPDVLRIAWGAMTRYVDQHGVELLFGCSSFQGTEAGAYLDAFALLSERHLAPKRWLPRVKAKSVFRFAKVLRLRKPDLRLAMKGMPPLLRTYLVMGGWVSDHAVVDRDLNTLHVFTGLEIKAIPKTRARLLRAVSS